MPGIVLGPVLRYVGEDEATIWVETDSSCMDWAAFDSSFEKLERLLQAVGNGEHGRPPASIVLLPGDVHHAYLAEVAFRPGARVRSAVYQAVCSPFRNALDAHERLMLRFALTRPGVAMGRALARAAR